MIELESRVFEILTVTVYDECNFISFNYSRKSTSVTGFARLRLYTNSVLLGLVLKNLNFSRFVWFHTFIVASRNEQSWPVQVKNPLPLPNLPYEMMMRTMMMMAMFPMNHLPMMSLRSIMLSHNQLQQTVLWLLPLPKVGLLLT